ncbi:MAG: hypothetical protein O2905_05450, partial [Proteobacteria bacterium]|nr:hypothetical protein [Pseudomonadota bacterium]
MAADHDTQTRGAASVAGRARPAASIPVRRRAAGIAVTLALLLGACGEPPAEQDRANADAPGVRAPAVPDARGAALVAEAEAANNLGRTEEARRLLSDAANLFEAAADRIGLATVELARATIDSYLGQSGPARSAFARALGHYRAAGNAAGEAETLAALGDLEKATFRYAEAREAFAGAVAAFDRAGRPPDVRHILLGLEDAAGPDATPQQARRILEQAHLLYWQIEDGAGLARIAELTAAVDERQGIFGVAYAGYREAASLYAEAGQPRAAARVRLRIAGLETALGFPLSARAGAEQALAMSRETGDDAGAGAALLALARIDRLLGDPATARARYREAEA